ncbi:GNAT family N-acetyltransferase [Roseibium sp.]|uniref:GNAT family N-acetyltransferase n=1 Tax=Roseibium sp. TaxID=1936156 RepID=UPI003BAD129D
MTTPSIRTGRLTLRPPAPDDLDRCAELLGDYEVAKMLSRVRYPYDLEQGRRYLERSAARWETVETADELGFHVDHQGEMIGGLGFKKLQETPEIGYWLGRPYWGKGFMSEALTAAVAWMFDNTAHELLACEAMTENPASIKVMEKAGFRPVGEVGCVSVSRGETLPAIRSELTRTDFMRGL